MYGEIKAESKKEAINQLLDSGWGKVGWDESMLKNDFICEDCLLKKGTEFCEH